MITFQDAIEADDPQLTSLVATPMPGKLSLAFCRQPSYLDSCAKCGPPRHVLTAKDGEAVVALCSYFLREYQWDGANRQVWTISDFRAHPKAAGRGITGRGWSAIRARLRGLPALISVLNDNTRTLELFAKPRPNWPRLHPVADLQTNISPLWGKTNAPATTRPLTPNEVTTFVNASQQSLRPLIENSDLLGQNYWGVFENGKLMGCAGLSTPHQYRQVKIHSYSGFYKLLHRLRLLPNPGSQVPLSTASLLICPQPGPPFCALFQRLKVEAQLAGSKFLVWSRSGRDRTRIKFRYPSRLYQLLWPGDQPLPQLGQSSFEVAWL